MKLNTLSTTITTFTLLLALVVPVMATSAPFDEGNNLERAERMQMRLRVIERYLSIVESVHSISDDSEKAVLYQLQQLEDIYKKQRSPEKIVALYQDILNKTSNQTVRNAASMKLAQIYKRLGRDNAAEELTRKSLEENLKRLK